MYKIITDFIIEKEKGMKTKKKQTKVGDFIKISMNKIKELYQNRRKLTIVIGVGALVLIVVMILLISSLSKSTKTVTYSSVKLTKGDITQTIDVVGNIEAVPSAILNWQTNGIVAPVSLKVGDEVKEGDALVSLVDNSVSSSILSAQNDLLAAQLTLNTLKNGNMQLTTATQALAVAQKAYQKKLASRNWWIVTGVSSEAIDLARAKYYETKDAAWNAQQAYQALYQKNPNWKSTAPDTATSNAYDAMKTAEEIYNRASRNLNVLIGNGYGNNNVVEQAFLEFDVAKATLAEAQATWQAYNNASPYVKAAEAKVQALQNTINSAKIIAPFTGTVTDLLATTGQTVSSGTQALQMDDLKNLMINVSVSEVDVNKLAVGQEASITFAAVSGKTYSGTIVQVGKAGSSASGVVEFYATIKVTDADANVKPGFSATISIVTSKVQNVLLVPNLAIATNTSGKSFVMVSKNGTTTPVAVELGSKSDLYTEVKSGDLKEGDTVLIALSSSSSSTTNNRAMFGIMGGFGGGGEPPRVPSTTSGSNPSNRSGQ
jgi:HlyD family secretion protein